MHLIANTFTMKYYLSVLVYGVLVGTLIYTPTQLTAQTKRAQITQTDSLMIVNRLDILEKQKENLDRQSELISREVEVEAKSLENKFDELTNKASRNSNTVFLLLGILSLFGLYEVFIGLKRRVNTALDKKLDHFLDEKKLELQQLIQDQDLETRLKTQSNIHVICEKETDILSMKKLLEKFGFKGKITYESTRTYTPFSETYDLVIIDDYHSDEPHDEMIRTHLEKTGTVFVIFTNRPFIKYLSEFRDKANAANSKYTFYSQLVNTLKIRHLLNA